MEVTLDILSVAGANIEPEYIQLREQVYLSGSSAGIAKETWDIINRNKIILKTLIRRPER